MNLTRVGAKELTPSDLTFFAAHFHKPGQRSKQKAINLNADVFVAEFYPGLRDRLADLHFGLTIIGPGNAPPYSLSRKAIRTQGAKNWRLDGELVNDPPDEPGRFARLAECDIALMAFEGTKQPEAVTLVLISQAQDTALHAETTREMAFVGRQSMRAVRPDTLRALYDTTKAQYSGGHPLETLFAVDSVEEAIFGSSQAQHRVAQSRDGRGTPISPESVRRQAAAAGEIGQLGEEAFERWLLNTGYAEPDYEWVSRTNARAAYDFAVTKPRWEPAGPVYIDVKSTKGAHDSPFHMSMAEVRWAARTPAYRVARVSSLTESSAQVRLLSGVSEKCQDLLRAIEGVLPAGVEIDSFEIDPSPFGHLLSETVRWGEAGGDAT